MQNSNRFLTSIAAALLLAAPCAKLGAQVYQGGLIDKSVAIVGNDIVLLSDIEEEVRMMQAGGYAVDNNTRCQIL